MAVEDVTDGLGEAVAHLFACVWRSLKPKLRQAFEQLADVVRPHPPMTIVTLTGERLTGVVVVDRGQALAFIGMRHPAPSSSPFAHGPYVPDDGPWEHYGGPPSR